MRRPLATAVAVALLAATPGCGGSKASDYRGKLNDVRERYEPRFDEITVHIQDDVTSHDQRALGRDARRGATLMAAYATEVARIDPPNKLKPQAEQLVAAYREWATALRKLAEGARTSRAATVNAALAAFNEAQRKEKRAVQKLNAAS
jgi:hypothetical protein